ncbi:hypothetical protein [Arthrobacter sp. NEB 688]|uniref:hypothetical protein n=1 Tax=Arthrobacter sp. NEB 688 TaxID=904039 RepID=UPI0015677FB5|nr:hypothetical protein [Arthrobacter sp. NEB 688]QKE85472.1 hypothetical protein HL663_17080 [Arthrobacter sp. NEB 688]
MPLGPDPSLARTALDRLDALRDLLPAAEDDLLACLVVTGEPRPQRVLDDWLDQAADTLRALGEVADEVAAVLAPHAAPSDGGVATPGTAPLAPVVPLPTWPDEARR